jgi:hypothetical protein
MIDQLTPEAMNDPEAVSLANIVSIAKRRAIERGVMPEDNYLGITQVRGSDPVVWRINFGPKTPEFARGGDFTVFVNAIDGSIHKELWGQ